MFRQLKPNHIFKPNFPIRRYRAVADILIALPIFVMGAGSFTIGAGTWAWAGKRYWSLRSKMNNYQPVENTSDFRIIPYQEETKKMIKTPNFKSFDADNQELMAYGFGADDIFVLEAVGPKNVLLRKMADDLWGRQKTIIIANIGTFFMAVGCVCFVAIEIIC